MEQTTSEARAVHQTFPTQEELQRSLPSIHTMMSQSVDVLASLKRRGDSHWPFKLFLH